MSEKKGKIKKKLAEEKPKNNKDGVRTCVARNTLLVLCPSIGWSYIVC